MVGAALGCAILLTALMGGVFVGALGAFVEDMEGQRSWQR